MSYALKVRDHVVLYLNGERREIAGEHAGWMLADYLRVVRGLTGTKIVCAEGDCGACSVLRWFPNPRAPRPRFEAINACIVTVAQMDGSSLVTVDALAAPELTPVQSAMMAGHASQCGFCTPGFVMALTGLVEKKIERNQTKSPLSCQEAKNALTGNLCRCTGYQPILEAATRIDLANCESVARRFVSAAQVRELSKIGKQPLRVESPEFACFAPRTLREAARELAKPVGTRMLAGGSDLGVVHNKRKTRLTKTVSLHLIPELYRIQRKGKRVRVGARVTLTELRRDIKRLVPEFARFLDLFASPQIKNVATLVGNLANGSPIADTPPFLLVAGATIGAISARSTRVIRVEDFYLGYRRLALKRGEFVAWIEFDVPEKSEALSLYKVSQRKDLDISTVNAAFRAQMSGGKIKESRLALGGVAATPVRLPKTEAVLKGQLINAATAKRAAETLGKEISPISDLRGSSDFRRVVAENLIVRFFRKMASG